MEIILAVVEYQGLNITIDSLVGHFFLPVTLPVVLFCISVTCWAYFVSKGTIRKYWMVPTGFLVVAILAAIVFHL